MKKLLFARVSMLGLFIFLGLSAAIKTQQVQTNKILPFGIGSDAHLRVGIQDFSEIVREQVSMGVNWMRESIPWKEVEDKPGLFRWIYPFDNPARVSRDFDRMLQEANDAGIEVLAVLAYGPNYPVEFPASFLEAWERYVQTVVDEYGDEIDYWEIGNEPNSREFWGKVIEPGSGNFFEPDPQLYAEMLSIAYDIIKSNDPSDTVVLAGLVTISEAEPTCETNPFVFLSEMYKAGVWNKFDAVGFHPYWGGFRPEERIYRGRAHDPSNGDCLSGVRKDNLIEEVNAMCELINRFGQKPVWITELGWKQSDLEMLASQRENTPNQIEADYLVRSYVPLISGTCVETVFWYTQVEDPKILTDKPHDDHQLDEIGKRAFANLANLLSNSSPLGQFQGQNDRGTAADDDVYEFRFEKNDQLIIVTWKARGGDVSRTVLLTGIDVLTLDVFSATAEDLTRPMQNITVVNGEARLELTEQPLLLLGTREAILIDENKARDWWSGIWRPISDWFTKTMSDIQNAIGDQFDAWQGQVKQGIQDFFDQLCGMVYLGPMSAIAFFYWNRKKRA